MFREDPSGAAQMPSPAGAEALSSPSSLSSGPDDTAHRILVAATQLFAEQGFSGTSLQQIADEVGLRKASVLHWYPSKAAIRDAVLDGVFDHWQEAVPHVLAAATRGSSRLDGLMAEVFAFFEADPHRARVLLRESLDRPVFFRQHLQERLSGWFPLLVDSIRLGQATGRVHANLDPEVWLVEVILLVVSSVAVPSVAESLLMTSGTEVWQRRRREVLRLVRASLFCTRPVGAISP